MATTSIPHRWKYDVFVSFRGEDIRKSFMDHLFNDFKQKGINAFRDDNELPKGEEISPHLYKAIEESRFLIVIFSKDYASSSWCLRELVKILECKQIENPKYEVRIIFYDVKPYVVRKQKRSYSEALRNHEDSNSAEVGKWKEALSLAANLSGFDLQDMSNGYESKFIDCISKDILIKLCDGPLHVGENLVGMDFHFDKFNLSRFVGSDKVNMIGICGISGIGKTTLAKAIYNLMFIHFEGGCFCEDVRKHQDLTQVQMQLIDDIMKTRELKISNVSQGIMVIRKMMSSKPILLVLDDVDHRDQLKALAGSTSWFCPGSLIIFTSKDKQLLRSHRVDEIEDMDFLDGDESLELFISYAFRDKHLPTGFQELAEKAVKYVQGHPLALIVLGCFLYSKTVSQWVSELERLREHPNEEIQQVLRLSYDGLNLQQQNILLDIACVFIGEKSDFVASILESLSFGGQGRIQPRWWTTIIGPFGLLSKQHPQRSVSLAGLHMLKFLVLSYGNLLEVPDSIGGLSFLEYLKLDGNNFTNLPGSLSQLSSLKWLDVEGCNKLEVLPELSPTVWTINAGDCTSLREVSKGPWSKIFRNCPKLFKNVNIDNEGFISKTECLESSITSQGVIHHLCAFLGYLGLQTNRCEFFLQDGYYHSLDIMYHGNSIPEWFTNRSTEKHVNVELPSDWCYDKNFRGFGTCVVFKRKRHFSTFKEYSVKNFDGASLITNDYLPILNIYFKKKVIGIQESYMIWLHFARCTRGWKKAKNFVTFCFGENNEDFEVKECGAYISERISDEDIQQERDLSILQGLPTPTQHGGMLVLARSAGRSYWTW